MSHLYVLATDDRIDYVSSKALRLLSPRGHVDVVKCTQSDRLTHLLALVNADDRSLDRSCFAVDGRDTDAVADFNAMLHAIRMRERIKVAYPCIIRSINII